MKPDAAGDLNVKRFLQVAVRGVKGIVVAVGASSNTFCAVAVRTGKPGINNNLLNSSAKGFPDIFRVGVEATVMFPEKPVIFQNLL